MKRSFAWVGCIVVLFAASCAQSAAIDAWDAPGEGLGGSVDDGESVQPRADASTRDAGAGERLDAQPDEPDEPSDEPDAERPADASTRDARTQPTDSPPRDAAEPSVVAPEDAGSVAPEPRDAGPAPTADAGECAACPAPGNACMTPLGRCGCRLLPFGPCGPRPPFAP
jgi:hypothetical protein